MLTRKQLQKNVTDAKRRLRAAEQQQKAWDLSVMLRAETLKQAEEALANHGKK